MGWAKRARQAIATWLYEGLTGMALGGYGYSNDPQLAGYRRITGSKTQTRDLERTSQESMLRVAHYLYESNPLAGWLIDQRVDLFLPSEMGYSVTVDPETEMDDDPETKRAANKEAKVIAARIKDTMDRFWEHPTHDLRFRGPEYITTLMVTGELCLVIAAENEIDGIPQLDCIDPDQIETVTPVEGSSMVPGTVWLRPTVGSFGPPRPFPIMQQDPQTGRLEGQCFFWRNTRILNAMRGRSELLRGADYIDGLDQFLFATVDRGILQNALVWDLKMGGANEAALNTQIGLLRGSLSKPGGIYGHNDEVELRAHTPQLGAADAAEHVRMMSNFIRGSKSMPEAWYAEGGTTNRATATEQTDTALKSLMAWQTIAKRVFNVLLSYAYDRAQAKQPSVLPPRLNGRVRLEVDLPPLAERDVSRLASTFAQLTASMGDAVESKFISRKTAQRTLLQVIDKLGTPVDPDDEEEQIQTETAEREAAIAMKQAAFAARGFAQALNGQGNGEDDEERPGMDGNGNGRPENNGTATAQNEGPPT